MSKIGLIPADIEWRDNEPFSRAFQDVYFSAEDGLAETEYVFLKHNRLADRWKEQADNEHFVIAETGFGTGLNVLMTWRLWRQVQDKQSTAHAPATSDRKHLHIVSIEKHPLHRDDFARALSAWPELKYYAEILLKKYPPLLPGRFRLWLDDDVSLTLIFDDVAQALPSLNAKVDAWFLDGFAPSKNNDMWQLNLFNAIAKHSRSNATFATFTAAGDVKRGLASAGFTVSKTKGFGRKRDMLIGSLETSSTPGLPDLTDLSGQPDMPTHNICHTNRPTQDKQVHQQLHEQSHQQPHKQLPKTAIIIGAGLAGAGAAAALSRYGVRCTVIDSNDAAAGSKVPAAVLRPYFEGSWSVASQLNSAGYVFTQQFATALPLTNAEYTESGVVKLAIDAAESKRQERLKKHIQFHNDFLDYLENRESSELLGSATLANGYYLAESATLRPQALCKHALQHANINVITSKTVASIEYKAGKWHTIDAEGHNIAQADACIIATGAATQLLPSFLQKDIRAVRGQTETALFASALKTPLNHKGYCVPVSDSNIDTKPHQYKHVFGASFVPQTSNTPWDLDINPLETAQSISKLNTALPEFILSKHLSSWVGMRAKCTGHLPAIGSVSSTCSINSVMNETAPEEAAAMINKDTTYKSKNVHLYVSTGHGARGTCSAFLAGEQIACEMLDMPLPFSPEMQQAFSPKRFIKDDADA